MKPKPKPASASKTQLADLIFPTHANDKGTAFGGVILAMADKAAGVCAMRHSGQTCVTVAMDRVEFHIPVRVGDLLIVEAHLERVGRTSMTIAVDVFSEELRSGRRQRTNTCHVTMVAVDNHGRPSPVPPLEGARRRGVGAGRSKS